MMMSSRYVIVKGKSFKTPVISSWKYAGAGLSPKRYFNVFVFSKW